MFVSLIALGREVLSVEAEQVLSVLQKQAEVYFSKILSIKVLYGHPKVSILEQIPAQGLEVDLDQLLHSFHRVDHIAELEESYLAYLPFNELLEGQKVLVLRVIFPLLVEGDVVEVLVGGIGDLCVCEHPLIVLQFESGIVVLICEGAVVDEHLFESILIL